MLALNGQNGEVLWQLKANLAIYDAATIPTPLAVDLYTVSPVRDLDEDSVPDVLAARSSEHRSSEQNTIAGHIALISGQSGKIIRTIQTPNREELYVPIQIHTQLDGTELILVLTGGQNSPGGVYLWIIQTIMDNSKETEFITVIHNDASGFMVPAILGNIKIPSAAIKREINQFVYIFS